MSLGRKLGRLSSAGPGSRPADALAEKPSPATVEEAERPDDRWDAFRAALRSKAAREERRPQPQAVPVAPLPGEVLTTEHGPLHRIHASHGLDQAHGDVRFETLLGVDPSAVARFALDESFVDADPSRFVFLDTETTGLAGGAGTVPFLVGVAYLRDGKLEVEQWLLRRFGEERPILERLGEILADASALVTYNGKSFDWPLLRTRYVLHRRPLPPIARHLDLVHGARRLLARRLQSVRLQDVERELLGFVREDDIDAALIPSIFLEFQRQGAHPDMERVLRHHAMDLTAMPAMLARFAAFLGERERPADALDRLSCASVVARSGHDAESRRFVQSLVADADGEVAAHGSLVAARQARRAGDVDAERASLERAVAEAREDEVAVHARLELAKHFEHRARDFARALEHSVEAARLSDDPAIGHRIERLRKRLERSR